MRPMPAHPPGTSADLSLLSLNLLREAFCAVECSTSAVGPGSMPSWPLASATGHRHRHGPDSDRHRQGKARDRGLTGRFLVWDALQLSDLNEQFDTVLDCGLFHVFEDDDRVQYVASLRAVLPPGGRIYMLCFSDRQPGDWGPRRVTQDEIKASFRDGWQVDSIEASKIGINIDPNGALAWRVPSAEADQHPG